jgi:hypothetical protein
MATLHLTTSAMSRLRIRVVVHCRLSLRESNAAFVERKATITDLKIKL